ncbi:MAG: hypothetical protein JWM68_4032 [Verrucomicrobiales bacterium]|nr:hypothetical protein [Verrucomicrobiales bacterium]
MDFADILARIGMAFLTGFILGLERESHGRAAGLRTTVLVCMAAAMAGILSDQFYSNSFDGAYHSTNWHPDPARLGAGILTGIGFLGAGVILRQGNVVRGVTTASLIWFTTILGLCYGMGHLLLGFIGLLLAVFTVFFLRYIEGLIKRDWYAFLNITTTLDGVSVGEINKLLKELHIVIKNVEYTHDAVQKTRTIRCSLRFKKVQLIELPERVSNALMQAKGVLQIDWK